MKQGDKGVWKLIVIALALLAVATIASAQFARKSRVKKGEVPAVGTFYSLTLDLPPFPYNPFPGLPVYALTNGTYVYDDRTVDYDALRTEQQASLATAQSLSLTEGEGGGGMMMLMGGEGNTNLALSIPSVSGGMVTMSLLNAKTNESHDIFSTTTVGTTNVWVYRGRLPAGQTELSLETSGSTSSTAYTAANSADSDGDTLPDGVETFATQTDPNTPDSPDTVPPGSTAAQMLADIDPEIYVKQFAEDYQDMSYFSFNTEEGYFGTTLWTRGVGGTGEHFEVLQLFPPQTVPLSSVTWDGNGNPTPSVEPHMPPARWFYRRYLQSGTSPLPNGHSQTDVFEVNTTTKIELSTGGPEFSTNLNLFVLNVQAADQDDVDPFSDPVAAVPPSDITVLGEHPDSNGRVWKIFADNQTVDVTPAVTSTHTNYDFTVSATKLKLKIMKGAQDITNTKRKIWIGEKPTLTAVLDPENFGTLSNFQWTVTGIRQADYIATTMLGSNVPLTMVTQQNVMFAWTVASELETVTVTAQLAGQTLTADARFEVMDATADWYGLPTGVISVHQRQGLTTLGLGNSPAPRGITMLLTNGNVNGCSSWEFRWAQIGNSTWWRQDGGLQWISGNSIGLDTAFPAQSWQDAVNGISGDSPGVNLANTDYQVWRGHEFDAYLFFQPAAPSIPVAIKKFHWKWLAYAVNLDTPNNGWQLLVDPPPAPLSITNAAIVQNNTIVTSNPTWVNNVTNRTTFSTNQPPSLP